MLENSLRVHLVMEPISWSLVVSRLLTLLEYIDITSLRTKHERKR